MNRECSGYRFEIDGTVYWRCLADGRTCEMPVIIQECPLCGRLTSVKAARKVRAVETRSVVQYRLCGDTYWNFLRVES